MPIVVACPSCQGKLRVADELREQMVRCPTCSVTFFPSSGETAPLPPPAPAANGHDLPLEMAEQHEPEGGEEGPSRSSDRPRLSHDDDDLRPCPRCGRLIHRDSNRCYSCGRRSPAADVGPLVRTPARRDWEPDRGAMVLTLGILSLVMLSACIPAGVILGLCAWVMGSGDLRKMREGTMDDAGQSMTHAGWICGILGTLINGVLTLACMGFFVFIFTVGNSTPTGPATPRPVYRQTAPAPQPAPAPRRQPNRLR